MKINTHALKGIAIALLLGLGTVQAQQTNNPYTTKYQKVGHWTDSLNWTNVVNVTIFGAVANDNTSDQAAIEAAINQVASNPFGGVVWFPAGTYNLTDDLKMKSGVILRGEEPVNQDAKQAGFEPLSKLEFPKYELGDTSIGGNPVAPAFKEITNENGGTSNVGFVWLDINRAAISMHPEFDSLGTVTHAGGTNADWQPKDFNKNCLVFGVRNNNVAIAQSNVPSGSQRPYQRFSWRFASNFDLYFAANCIIANCRINDAVTDNFNVDNYLATNARKLPLNNGTYEFSYTDHYGITLNRAKIRKVNGVPTIQPFIWYPTPAQEPSLYRKGMEVRDNWVYKTMRVGIIAAGSGLLIDGNITRDKNNKETALTPDGRGVLTNYSATYENRGIDFSGWDVTITNNDVEVRAHDFPPSQYNSVDGEGIMNQGNSGGSLIDGLVAKYNTINSNIDRGTNPGIGCYRTQNINNVLVDSNNFTGANGWIYLVADQGGGVPYQLSNVIVRNNTNAKNISVTGTLGGVNSYVENNTSTRASSVINASCHVILNNNTGYNTINGCLTTRAVDPTFPQGAITGPAADTTIRIDLLTPTIFVYGLVTSSGTIDSIAYFIDNQRLGTAASANNLFSFPVSTTGFIPGTYSIKARLYSGTFFSSTQLIRIHVLGLPVGINKALELPTLQFYPNPVQSQIHLRADANWIEVIDITGKHLISTGQANSIDVSKLTSGLYYIKASIGNKVYGARFVK